ncbi:MAG: efflux RND transporter periplasmic adaptor subunit [Burkholderiales bacterium]
MMRALVMLPVVAAVAGYFAYPRIVGRAVSTVAAMRMDLIQTVVATGRVITPARIELGTVVVGTISKVSAREGDVVKAGAVLATLRDDELRAAVAQTQAASSEAEARLAQLGNLAVPVADQSLKQADANFIWARDELERTRRLAEKGFFSLAKVEEAERNAAVARAARDSATAQAATNRPQGSDYALAVARREQAKAAVAAAQARLDYATIKTPVAGTVLKRVVEPGDVVQAGKTLFELAASGPTQLVLQVDEKNLASLRLGQDALVVADAYPSERFGARVFYIAPGIDAQRGSVEVKLAVADVPKFVKPDMTVSVEITAGRADNAIVIPTELIRESTSATPWALVVYDGHAVRRSLKLGLRGTGRTQILDGIAAGERVIPPTVAVVEGALVRATESPAIAAPALKAQEIIR